MKYCKAMVSKCYAWVVENGLSQPFGATVSMLCDAMGIAESTYHKWKETKTDFSETIKKAREAFANNVSREVASSLAKRARGYKYTEVKTEMVAGAAGKPVIARMTKTEKEVAPETAAAIFILTNVDAGNWKNRQSKDITSGGEPLQVIVSGDKARRDLGRLDELLNGKEGK